MRGAGCTLNDIVDRDFDARVARTRSRPIPSGQVTVPAAFLFMGLELAVGAAVLVSLRPLAIALALAILAVVVIYPFMKRVTFWPQLFLGINFNWGAVVGWAAATGRLDWPALALYAAGICWTLGYDTIYAHADKADDLAIGVKSTALRLAERSRAWVAGFFAAASAGLALALGLAHAHWLSYLFLAMAACHFAWQVRGWRLDDPADCIARFKSNRFVGWLVLAGCLAAGLPR
jgi:4-hydroxybenzoate polyprenyltransferase